MGMPDRGARVIPFIRPSPPDEKKGGERISVDLGRSSTTESAPEGETRGEGRYVRIHTYTSTAPVGL